MPYSLGSYAAADEFKSERQAIDPGSVYVEARYPNGTTDKTLWPWGVQRWYRYADRPELGLILDGFVWWTPRR